MKYVYRTLAVLLLLAIILIVIGMRMNFRTTDTDTYTYFAKRHAAVSIKRIPYAADSLRWVVSTGQELGPEAPLIVFVHGAPGSMDNFHFYLADSTLRQRALLVALDRPGYGYSNLGKSAPSFAAQAAAIHSVIEQYPNRPVFLVGHSYGGPIIAELALAFPDRVRGLLMLAPVNDPDSEPIFWFARLAKWPPVRWMLSPAWRVSGDEKLSHVAELQRLQPRWEQLKIPVMHLHGDKDTLAPASGNIAFSKRHIAPAMLHMEEMPQAGHLIPFLNQNDVVEDLLRLLDM